ncbi:MAG: bactofilin family protein [Woeseiaceae bacterium]
MDPEPPAEPRADGAGDAQPGARPAGESGAAPGERHEGYCGPSIIGATLVMRGELTLDEDLIIDGTFDGTVIDGAHRLSVGAFAQVRARIRSESAEIAGTVDGDFEGRDTVVLRKTARIRGDWSARRVRVEAGTNLENVVLSGRISRVEDDSR